MASVEQIEQRQLVETREQLIDMANKVMPCLDGVESVMGLESSVEILRDKWGVPHIYATSTHDLFFAQGYVAAQDRLYQMEMWRRSASGEMAEILGPAYLERDRLARLMRYRGDMAVEWRSYGNETKLILNAFANGINAYIDKCGNDVPIEFTLLGFRPKPWKADDCLLRQFSPRIVANTTYEIARCEMITRLGIDATIRLMPTDPHRILAIDPEVDLGELSSESLSLLVSTPARALPIGDGSNCWAVNGSLSATGKPLLASDPHRAMTLPALRYMCHLAAPDWNVIGSGEPHLPGIALGHNDRIAFGFAVAPVDQADLYIETLCPENSGKYRDGQDWISVITETTEIRVKGNDEPTKALLRFTRHGPIVWESKLSNQVVALRWTGAEPGTAAYLGCLGVDQAKDWRTFRRALECWRMPAENMIYADVDDNVGVIATGILPIRKTWDGLLPVAGHDSRHEWNGFRSSSDMPYEYNPRCNFVVNANNKIGSQDHPHAIAFDWKAPYRFQRISNRLCQLARITIDDFKRLQHDEYSLPACEMIELLRQVPPSCRSRLEKARALLLGWDCIMTADSSPALLFKLWLTHLRSRFIRMHVQDIGRAVAGKYLEMPVLLRLLASLARGSLNELVGDSLEAAFSEAAARFGPNTAVWRWGSLHTVRVTHPLSDTESRSQVLDMGEFECGGDEDTVNCTRGAGYKCETAASHRQLIDLSDWDRSLFINIPGQSGQPSSPHYRDLLDLWKKKDYAPMLYSRKAVEENTTHRLILVPSPTKND